MDSAAPSPGDTAWILSATALVLFMTIPGLALFYGGLVRTKNVLSVLMQCLALTALITVLWVLYGYSLAFDTTGMQPGVAGVNAFIGSPAKVFLAGVTNASLAGVIPETVFVTFQMTFAIITPGLIVGAFAERMKFSAMLLFSALWFTIVYLPVCHMVWGGKGAYMADMGVLDFAGGIVVHITAGLSALVAAVLIGKRRGYPETPMPPHSMMLTVTGTGMLWVGWFGFNAGSALMANGQAGMAMLVTQISPSVAALTWMTIEWFRFGKPSVLGFATGAIGGLAAITPASGTVGIPGAFVIGLVAGVGCFVGATTVKRAAGYDDALDVFGVHGIGGIIGTLLVGVFAADTYGGQIADLDVGKQLRTQFVCATLVATWSVAASFALLKMIDAAIGLRVSDQEENQGLDLCLHNETGYNF